MPISLGKVKPDTSENLLYQIIYFLYREKEITKKVYNNINEFNKIIKQNGYHINEF